METEQAKELKIINHNNCLSAEVFITIGFAPAKEKIPTWQVIESALFYTAINEQKLFLKCIDVRLMLFKNIYGDLTLWAYGKMLDDYREWWLKEHPETKPETEMIICYYKKAE
jgi:hypothetical protein